MKKISTALALLMLSLATLNVNAAGLQQVKHVTKSGAPDKRYTANQHLTKSGTPDKRYNDNQNLKKDGTKDMRYKANQPAAAKPAPKKKP